MASARRRRVTPRVADLLVLDAEGVSKAASGDADVAADASVNRVLKAAAVVPADELLGRRAGALLAKARSSATVDAFVAATAGVTVARLAAARCVVLTSDPDDLRALLAPHPATRVVPV